MRGQTEIYTAAWGVVADRLLRRPHWTVRDGIVTAVSEGSFTADPDALVFDLGHAMVIPGFVNAHCHAFQRGIRGATQRHRGGSPQDFWSWRHAMYEHAQQLTPEGVYAITRLAYEEMLRAGITCVGEFHYLHHQADGSAYDDANELSWQIVRAASDVGIRLVLLEVYYARSGPGQEVLPEQRRFHDRSVDDYLQRVENLRHRGVAVGIAPHSIRAVAKDDLAPLADYARRHTLPLHAHVSEQRAENETCQTELAMSPLQAFERAGCLDGVTFTAVHATHMESDDVLRLSQQLVCSCPTTEADLGDGLAPLGDFVAAGSQLCLGSDSNTVIDLIQEARAMEMNERLRTESRLCLRDASGQVAPVLLGAATRGGARALGQPALGQLAVGHPFDACTLELEHPFLRGVSPELALDAAFLAGTAQLVGKVFVAGRRMV